jgi:hypothetical protein
MLQVLFDEVFVPWRLEQIDQAAGGEPVRSD